MALFIFAVGFSSRIGRDRERVADVASYLWLVISILVLTSVLMLFSLSEMNLAVPSQDLHAHKSASLPTNPKEYVFFLLMEYLLYIYNIKWLSRYYITLHLLPVHC